MPSSRLRSPLRIWISTWPMATMAVRMSMGSRVQLNPLSDRFENMGISLSS